jgi:hypothetical protein
MAHSLLTVPVPDLDAVMRPRLVEKFPELVPAAPEDHVAHVTLLSPFVAREDLTPGVLAELRRFFADVTPFPFTLTELSMFPRGEVYLAPSPSAPFRQLALGLARRFPEHLSLSGTFEVVPHVVVPTLGDESLEQLGDLLTTVLPVTTYAQEAALTWSEPGASETLEVFPFGTTAA